MGSWLTVTIRRQEPSQRPIALVDDEAALLRQQRRAQAAMRLAAGDWQDNGLVFTDGVGRPIDQYRLRRTFKRLLEDAELPVVNLYSLRRTMASIMHALEVPAKVIASRMGHADTQVLFRHYIKEFDAQDREAAVGASRQNRGSFRVLLNSPVSV